MTVLMVFSFCGVLHQSELSKLRIVVLNFRVLPRQKFKLFMFGIKCMDDGIDFTSVHKVKHLDNCIWELGNKMECTKISLSQRSRTVTSQGLNL